MEPGQIARHLQITGRVQRVGFRASMVQAAAALRVSGWVRNRSDGSVEALVQGSPAQVEQMIAWARQGPIRARVDGVDVTHAEVGDFTDFRQRETA